MKVNILNFLNYDYRCKNKTLVQSFTINPFKTLNRDTISFSRKLNQNFKTEEMALKYYMTIAKKINASLNKDDDLTAFYTLGYDVSSDFETDKITINGDYKPYFEFKINRRLKTIPYKSLGIDEKKLLKNVEKINGKIFPYLEYQPDFDFKIDNSEIYPDEIAAKFLELLQDRAKKINEALDHNEDQKALEILGFETQKDKNGKITILSNYSAGLLKTKDSTITISDLGISENQLLRNVVEIDANACFGNDFIPDHYIKARTVKYLEKSKPTTELEGLFIRTNPKYIQLSNRIKKLCEQGNYQEAMLLVNPLSCVDNKGRININGNFDMSYMALIDRYRAKIPLKEIGFDEKKLLDSIGIIRGNLNLCNTGIKELPPNMIITGHIYKDESIDDEEFFKNYISLSDFSKQYRDISPKVISNYITYGIIKRSISTNKDLYLNPAEVQNSSFFRSIIERKNEILTPNELRKNYDITSAKIKKAVEEGRLKPYRIQDIHSNYTYDKSDFLFDITDEDNTAMLSTLKKINKSPETNFKNSILEDKELNDACIQNSIRFEYETNDIKNYPLANLEKLGFGSKADLMANCGLRINAYEIKRYILYHDIYNISTPFMMDIVLKSKKNNPSVVKLVELAKILGQNFEDFKKGVIEGKLTIITDIPYRLTYPKDYCVDLSNPKNLEFLRKIDNKDFQAWLEEKIEAKKEYTEKNMQAMLEFEKMSKSTYQARLANIRKQLDDIEESRKSEQEKRNEQRKKLSLRSTIAWVLCPKTRQAKKELLNSRIQEIFARKKEIQEISEQLLTEEITFEEAKEKISKLQLSQKDEITILAYHKLCWDTAGTQEWKQALLDAKNIMESYKKYGLESIENDELKQRLIEWEKKWGSY